MKKTLLIAACISVSSLAVMGQATGTMQPMFEEFTQASCGPCAQQNPAFNALLDRFEGQVNSLKYQTSWPGVDPMYTQTSAEVGPRTSYYGVSGVPTAYMNGVMPTGASYEGAPANFTDAKVNAALAIPAPVEVDVVWEWLNVNLDSISVSVTVRNTNSGTDFTSADKLHVVLVEEEITFAEAPGTNGETEFFMVMRDMITGSAGMALGTVADGAPVTETFDIAVPEFIYSISQLGVVAFVQNNASKAVFNSGYQGLAEYPEGADVIDIVAEANSVGPNGLCEYALTPAIDVSSKGSTNITSFDASYRLNGGDWVTKSVEANIGFGESNTVTFDETTIDGATTVEYEVSNVNGGVGVDVDPSNQIMTADVYNVLSAASIGTSVNVDFENNVGRSRDITNVIFDSNISSAFFGSMNTTLIYQGAPTAGGYGNSNSSMFAYLYAVPSGSVMNALIDKQDFTNNNYPALVFDYSYAQISSQNDRLQVFVSADCGDSWTNVFDKAGNDLITQSPDAQSIAIPSAASDWNSATVDLSAFANTDEVVIKFTITSNGGNSMWIDNVETKESSVGIEEHVGMDVSVFPNPATDNVSVVFNAVNASDLSLYVYNAFGQIVKTVSSTQYVGESRVDLDLKDLSAGVYYLNVMSESGLVVSKRFVKQ